MESKWKKYVLNGGLAAGLTLGLAGCAGDNNPPPEMDYPEHENEMDNNQGDNNEMENENESNDS
ncbi:hypothetical protein [Bacillus sp. B-jedd]|uniref:hypothetical protein n=1 Tax=Bacillus sp. B-jedd TaxID=1476857 RepID=UPI0005155962|nr:hypothetical protein [Bacillus sp. B-jedd]CEG26269.1 hypothetical protein BN1002_01111 [Bacillus sp. B-jedd]